MRMHSECINIHPAIHRIGKPYYVTDRSTTADLGIVRNRLKESKNDAHNNPEVQDSKEHHRANPGFS
jgi:hypothetical protein